MQPVRICWQNWLVQYLLSAAALSHVIDLWIRDEQVECHRMAGTKVSCLDFVQFGATAWISALAFASGLVNFLKFLFGSEHCVLCIPGDPLVSELFTVKPTWFALLSPPSPSCWPLVFCLFFANHNTSIKVQMCQQGRHQESVFWHSGPHLSPQFYYKIW